MGDPNVEADSPKHCDSPSEKDGGKGDMNYTNEIEDCNVNEKNCNKVSLLLSIPPEVREMIWKNIPSWTITSTVRKTCRKLRDDADHLIGNYAVLNDCVTEFMDWSYEVAIKCLCVEYLMTPLSRWCPKPKNSEEKTEPKETFLRYPHLLREIKLKGPISVENLREILTSCQNVESLSVLRNDSTLTDDKDSYLPGFIGSFQNLFKKYGSLMNLPAFVNLRKIDLVVSPSMENVYHSMFLDGFVLILLDHQLICPKLRSFTIEVKCDGWDAKTISDRLLKFLCNKPAMKHLEVKLPGWIFEIPRRALRQNVEPTEVNSEIINFSQLDELSLEILSHGDYRGWFSLLETQSHLKTLEITMGSLVYWNYYCLTLAKCFNTLTKITLRNLTTISPSNMQIITSDPMNLGIFSVCENLTSLNLSGYDCHTSTGNDVKLTNLEMLPQCIQQITFEGFKIDPENVHRLHNHLINMNQLNLSFWNRNYKDLETSIYYINVIMMKDRNYRQICIRDRTTLGVTTEEEMNQLQEKSLNIVEELIQDVQNNKNHPMTVDRTLSTYFTFNIQITEVNQNV